MKPLDAVILFFVVAGLSACTLNSQRLVKAENKEAALSCCNKPSRFTLVANSAHSAAKAQIFAEITYKNT